MSPSHSVVDAELKLETAVCIMFLHGLANATESVKAAFDILVIAAGK